jgi:heptaprenyl diphosphate synthase
MNTKWIAQNSILITLALIISYVERLIPVNSLLPVPGFKLGLANIVTVYILINLDYKSLFSVTVLRCILANFLFGSMMSLVFALSGAFFAIIIMIILKRGYEKYFSIIGISIAGATMHNTGQIIAASFILNTGIVFSYLPVLLLSSILTGIITGIIADKISNRLSKTII